MYSLRKLARSLDGAFVLVCLACWPAMLQAETWAERLGYPAGKKVLLLHADDIGMSWEANEAAVRYFQKGEIQSGSVMIPCPWAMDFATWRKENTQHDVGVHLTLNSEWRTYRWGPTERFRRVCSLLDRRGFLHPDPEDTFLRARGRHVLKELRAQVRRAFDLGIEPTHVDTHIGTVYTRPDFLRAYLRVSRENGIPAMTMENVEATARCLLREDFPFKDRIIKLVAEVIGSEIEDYPYPRLDVLCSIPRGDTYEEVRQGFFDLVRSLEPGITQILFHPSVDTQAFRRITDQWQQRVWESQLFADAEVKQFFEDEGILFTTWREMMRRFRQEG